MSRPLIGPKCRLCRRERQKLFLKGEKCFTPKCPVARRAYPPGIHGQATFKLTEYGRQLREKQKLRRTYGITEKQLAGIYAKAAALKGVTGTKMLELLETRLDNVVYRAGLATSRNHARQLVAHGHMRVNDRRVDIPSYQVNRGDIITIRDGSKKKGPFIAQAVTQQLQEAGAVAASPQAVARWLNVDGTKQITVTTLPDAGELETMGFLSQMIVEFYSR